MCGRYAFFSKIETLADFFKLENRIDVPPNYNAAPGQRLPVIIQNRIGLAEWGLRPASATRSSHAPRPINARYETVARKAIFQDSFKRRRCIVPANGFYEWQKTKRNGKRPWFIYPAGAENKSSHRAMFFLAGIWNTHTAPDNATDSAQPQVSFAILTRPASKKIRDIHPRQPVILPHEAAIAYMAKKNHQAWALCDETDNPEIARHSVGPAVNSPANNEPDLMTEKNIEQFNRESGRLL